MVQMTQNFDQTCIAMVYTNISKRIEKFQKLADFCPKNLCFFNLRAKFSVPNFRGKFMRFLGNGPIDPISGINVP